MWKLDSFCVSLVMSLRQRVCQFFHFLYHSSSLLAVSWKVFLFPRSKRRNN
uniref:Uncharacterized protein n=1 Tax=Anguilla anguilla TaxID=7936 RepID=A0A0E9VUB7_ANGAN